jgi:hypothetical protein
MQSSIIFNVFIWKVVDTIYIYIYTHTRARARAGCILKFPD